MFSLVEQFKPLLNLFQRFQNSRIRQSLNLDISSFKGRHCAAATHFRQRRPSSKSWRRRRSWDLEAAPRVVKPKRCKKYLQRSPSPFPLPVGERGRGEGKRSPQVMFSNRGEEQFAPHETMAVEHFAQIFLHLVGSLSGADKTHFIDKRYK